MFRPRSLLEFFLLLQCETDMGVNDLTHDHMRKSSMFFADDKRFRHALTLPYLRDGRSRPRFQRDL